MNEYFHKLWLLLGFLAAGMFSPSSVATERIECNDSWRFARFGMMPEGG